MDVGMSCGCAQGLWARPLRSSWVSTVCLPSLSLGHCCSLSQATKSVLSVPNKDMANTQNDVERLEIREQTKSKSEAKWKYKVSCGHACLCVTNVTLCMCRLVPRRHCSGVPMSWEAVPRGAQVPGGSAGGQGCLGLGRGCQGVSVS